MLCTTDAHRPSIRRRGALAVALLALLLPGGLLAQGGAETPEALLAAAQEAAAARDVAALVVLTAPSQLHMLAFGTDMAADMMGEMGEDEASQALGPQVAAVRERYGVDVDADEGSTLEVGPDTKQEEIDAHMDKRARKRYEGVDLPGYVGEVTALLLALPQMADKPLFPPGEVGEAQVDGDSATVRVGEQDIQLVREDGRWYLGQLGG